MASRSVLAWLKPEPGSEVDGALREGKSPWADAVHLLWTVWVFITPAFTPAGYDLRWLLLTLVSYPLFLWLYAKTLLVAPRRVARYAYGMVALCLALLPLWYPSGLSYFAFGCVMLRIGLGASVWGYLLRLMVLNVLAIGWAFHLGYPWMAVAWLPVVSFVIGLVTHFEAISKRSNTALRMSHDEVRRLAALAERERIGRDLHDLLGHTLSLVALKSDLAGRLLEHDPRAARHEIGEVSRVARDALSQVRRAVTGIRAAGIAAELASARLLLESDGIAFEYDADLPPLPPEHETALALALREAVTNLQRHARARQAWVELHEVDGDIVLRVEDDGRGGDIVPGNGLGGMRERVEGLGGRLRIESRRGHGTRVEASLPLPTMEWTIDAAPPESAKSDGAALDDATTAPGH
ncbi:sensor histidine kinase [Marilutibacter chinensis]|uniref:Sensor histidine kinase n=1 Tax=Marilutibacter chinensis TaxID=2912247 RepID=A0ABS9HT36_9GAMM|nr:sensor histidine kinase [Lysobacter chinensis]MCF7221463.1 sensor histidine kinase [Lysobacter chinensis]